MTPQQRQQQFNLLVAATTPHHDIFQILADHARENARKRLEGDATKAGYDDVDKYIKYSARLYQECVAEKGAEDSMCKAYKNYWLECKETQKGFNLSRDDEFAHMMLEKDASEGGYKDKYSRMKDPKHLKTSAFLYEECVAEKGAENSTCKGYKNYWLECKAAQNGHKVAWNEEEVHNMLRADATKAGYKEGYCLKKDPKFLKANAYLYEQCAAMFGADYSKCQLYKKYWLESKAAQNA